MADDGGILEIHESKSHAIATVKSSTSKFVEVGDRLCILCHESNDGQVIANGLVEQRNPNNRFGVVHHYMPHN